MYDFVVMGYFTISVCDITRYVAIFIAGYLSSMTNDTYAFVVL